jgi:hypothetical protein
MLEMLFFTREYTQCTAAPGIHFALTVGIPERWELQFSENPIFGPIFLQPPETQKTAN